MIALHNVSKTFGDRTAVKKVTLEVAEGTTMVLLGTSGCGKTTTLRMVNRLTEPSSGNIVVNGVAVLKQKPEELRRGIGYVLQHTGLFPHYTISQNIAVVPQLIGRSAQQITQRVKDLLHKLELDPKTYAHKYPHELSGGQQQRIGLARALAADPPVLLMDEPFGALDPVTRAGIRKQFKQLDELKRKTILMVTHDVQEAFEMGDHVCLMNAGEVVQVGTPKDLLFSPNHSFTQQFLKEHRLQLELQHITVGKLISYLPVKATGTMPATTLQSTTLWQALERLSLPTASDDLREGRTHLNWTTGELMAAFEHYKKQLTHG